MLRTRLHRRVLPIGILAILGPAALVLFVTPPRGVLRALARTFPGALLTGSDAGTSATRAAKRSIGLYVRSALASRLADRIDATGRPDHDVLVRVIDAVRGSVLNQVQVPHPSRTWSPLVSGFGYCDQINAAVARVAAHFFHDAQIYALYDAPRKMSPHTIGRVWSDERGDWMYFDAFYDVPIVFTKDANGSPNFLGGETVRLPSRGRPLMDVYRLPGWVMNEYRPSLGGQIGVKVMHRLGMGSIESPPPSLAAAPLPPAPATLAATPVVATQTPAAERPGDDVAFERVVRAYATARMDHLLEQSPDRSAYLSIAAEAAVTQDPRVAEFATAAQVFATAQ